MTAVVKDGGKLEAITKRLESKNLRLENMIGFAPWFSEDLDARAKGLEQLRQDMNMTAEIGGKFIAAPVQGVKALNKAKFDDYIERFLTIF